MAINFPDSPSQGQILNVSPGNSFIYISGAWIPAPVKTALPTNYFINPACQHSQEKGTTASSNSFATYYYSADQWYVKWEFSPPYPSINTNQQLGITPGGSPASLKITVVTASAASLFSNDFMFVAQYIEAERTVDWLWGTPNARQLIMRFGMSGAPYGTYSVRFANTAATRSYVAQFVYDAGNAAQPIILVIPGDTTGGSWPIDSASKVMIDIVLAAGSAFNGVLGWQAGNKASLTGQANVAGAIRSVTLYDFGLYLDPYQTGVVPPFVIPDYVAELRACRRYWYRAYGLRGGASTTTNAARMGATHPVQMRITPTLTRVGTINVYDGAATPALTANGTAFSNNTNIENHFTMGTAATAQRATVQYWTSVDNYIAVSARP